jgi:hypothetical protein
MYTIHPYLTLPVPVPSLVVVGFFLVFDVDNVVVVAASVGIGGS